jgi:hypothetical protein
MKNGFVRDKNSFRDLTKQGLKFLLRYPRLSKEVNLPMQSKLKKGI